MLQVFPAPSGPRALFELFALYLPERGLDSILDSIDFSGMDAAAVHAVFGRKAAERPAPPGYSPRTHLKNKLHAPEFRERGRQLFLNAYPGKKRAIFVHIPKCAGTDLTAALRRQYPTLEQMLFRPAVRAEELFIALRNAVLGLRYTDMIAVTGHERLEFYHQRNVLVRPQDWLFTIVRAPQALVYSHLSYVLTVCRDAPRTRRQDGLEWLAYLGLNAIPEHVSAGYMTDLARKLLHDPQISPPNTICGFLGAGTAHSALEEIVASNIEITDTKRYAAWRAAAFPNAPASRENASHPYFTPDLATQADRDHIAALTQEDEKLFAAITTAFAREGALSIRGRELG